MIASEQTGEQVAVASVPPIVSPTPEALCWYAVRTRSRHEKMVAGQLAQQGFEVFLPVISQLRRWSDRRKLVEMPLFSGYAFARFAYFSTDRVRILQSHGVCGIVSAKGVGLPIPEDQITGVRTLLAQNIPFKEYPFLRVGQRIRIRGGALDGLQGILLAVNGSRSLVISVEPIQRSICVQIGDYHIESI